MSAKLVICLKYKYLLYYRELSQKGQICFMSKNTKKSRRKKNKAAYVKPILSNKPANLGSQLNPRAVSVKRGAKLTAFFIFTILLLILVLVPKPSLLTYKKSSMVSQSVYWPGLFSSEPKLLDSTLHPRLDKEHRTLYLCIDLQQPQSCRKYRIIAEEGIFSVLLTYF